MSIVLHAVRRLLLLLNTKASKTTPGMYYLILYTEDFGMINRVGAGCVALHVRQPPFGQEARVRA
jgi:hypothetical protein